MTSPSLVFLQHLFKISANGCHDNGHFVAKIRFLVTNLYKFIYQDLCQNGQFRGNINFEMPFLGKWQKRVILIFAFYDKSMNFGI